jgi:hypothetical protein
MARAALRLLHHADLRRRLSAGAQAALAPFAWTALATRAERAYLLAQHALHAPPPY